MKNLFCWILFPILLKTFFHTSSYIFWNISSSLCFNTVDPFFYFVNILGEVFYSESFFILVVSIPDKAHTDFNLSITTFNCLFANRVQSLLCPFNPSAHWASAVTKESDFKDFFAFIIHFFFADDYFFCYYFCKWLSFMIFKLFWNQLMALFNFFNCCDSIFLFIFYRFWCWVKNSHLIYYY